MKITEYCTLLIILVSSYNITCLNAQSSTCYENDYECSEINAGDNKTCISLNKICNGIYDCQYGEDELLCDYPTKNVSNKRESSLVFCSNKSLSCFNKIKNTTECVDLITFCSTSQTEPICDNHQEIENEILKKLCIFFTLSKVSVPFDCGGNLYISKEMVCDGNADCPNGLDEIYSLCSRANCEYRCENNQCTLNKYLCDGINQCTDGSDEINCAAFNNTKVCDIETEFECLTSLNGYERHCINKTEVCDSQRNCLDGSDEWPSLCLTRACNHSSDEFFKCAWNGACIEKSRLCDDIYDCADYSDESDCFHDKEFREENFYCTFKCRNGTCLHNQQLCDRFKDCENGEDELMCNYTICSNKVASCGRDINVICKVKPYNNYTCECKKGFYYDKQSKLCLDVNECELGRCSQLCVNTHSSYICDCHAGFSLKYGHCLENTLTSDLSVLYSDQNRIFKFNMNTNYSELIFMNNDAASMSSFKISDFDYSFKKDLIFVSEFYKSSIYIYSHTRQASKKIFITNNQIEDENKNKSKEIKSYQTLLTYDWIHENIYFNSNNSIYVIGPIDFDVVEYSYEKIISHVFEIRSLLVSPSSKSIFWLDVAFGTIESSRLDGSDRKILVKNVLNVQALAIDHTTSRLYWLDVEHKHIATSDFNGNNLFVAFKELTHRPFSISSFEKNLYYIYNERIINLTTNTKLKISNYDQRSLNRLIQTDDLNRIHVYNRLYQPENVVSPCQCNSCLCIPLGDTLTQNVKCLCNIIEAVKKQDYYKYQNVIVDNLTNSNSIIYLKPLKRHYSVLIISMVIVFIGSIFVILFSFRANLMSRFHVKQSTRSIYTCRFIQDNQTLTEKEECNTSINTADSVVDIENKMILDNCN